MSQIPGREQTGVTTAVDRLFQRVQTTAEQVADRFPLYADPDTGHWTTTRRGAWTGGFWSGLLWRTAARTGRPDDHARAAATTALLRPRLDDDTDTRALTFWHGAAQGSLRCGDPAAHELALAGADMLARAWSAEWGAVPAGSALGRGTEGQALLTIDSAAAVIDLMTWAARTQGRADWENVAQRHAQTVLRRCVRQDGAVLPAVRLTGAGHHGAHQPGQWARGQAWGVLALAAAGERLAPHRGAYLDAACAAADFWIDRTRGALPAWGLEEGDGPCDTSAAAIAAEALLRLADLADAPRHHVYRDAAEGLLSQLAENHLTSGDDLRPAGMLLDGCYNLPAQTAVAHELIWGTYFYLSALLRAQDTAVHAPDSGR